MTCLQLYDIPSIEIRPEEEVWATALVFSVAVSICAINVWLTKGTICL